MHPLREQVKTRHIFSCIPKYFKAKAKPNFKDHLRECLILELGFELPKTDMDLSSNPYLSCGYGINSFIENLKFLSMVMLTLTIFAIPVYYIYS